MTEQESQRNLKDLNERLRCSAIQAQNKWNCPGSNQLIVLKAVCVREQILTLPHSGSRNLPADAEQDPHYGSWLLSEVKAGVLTKLPRSQLYPKSRIISKVEVSAVNLGPDAQCEQ